MNINDLDDVCSYGILYIKEQNLVLVMNNNYSVFQKKDDMYVIIANEQNFYGGKNMGDLMTGIIKLVKVEENGEIITNIKLILPFSKKLLRAKFISDDEVCLTYMENKTLKYKTLSLQKNKTLLESDYAFLFEESPELVKVKARTSARSKVKS